MSYADIIKDIKISGNKRISKESIIVFGKIEKNIDYSNSKLNSLLKELYKTNFFKKVQLNIDNNILNIVVVENPIIESLEINGIKSKKLNEVLLEKMSLKSRKSYIESIFQKDVNLVKNIIKSNGYYFAEIKTNSISNDEQNSIRLIYDITLGKKAKINEIQFLGDKKFKDRKLINVITSEETRFWKFISNRSHLDVSRINLDKRLLTNYYKNNGYYNIEIENSFVEFKNDGSFKLVFNIDSGKKFTFNQLDLIIPDSFDVKYFDDIKNLLGKLKSESYSLNKIEKILKEIDKIALNKQYEFINANLTENIIDGNKLNIIISLDESEKFYVEKINILGNQYTLEEVIRNTFIVDEGDPYNEILFNKSINNLKAQNLFGFVETKLSEGSNPNLKVIDITVEEKPTGEISLGAGVGTTGGTLGGGIKENNFLGKGIKLDTNVTFTKNSVKGQFKYVRPNFNNTDNTLFTSIKSTTTDRLTDFGYKTSELGFSLGTSFEQYEDLYFKPEFDTSVEKLETNSSASSTLKKQDGNYLDSYFNYTLDYDLRDQKFRTTDGTRTIFFQAVPIISDNFEITNSFDTTKYQKLTSDMIGKINFFAKSVHTIQDDDVRISKRLFVPGSKLRGFESGKIGPIENNDFIGGNYVTGFNLSTTLPQVLPSFQNTDVSFFIDTANVWGVDYDGSIDDSNKIRSATGVALDLMTPIGPLNFSLATPITKQSTDITESFRFNLGTTF